MSPLKRKSLNLISSVWREKILLSRMEILKTALAEENICISAWKDKTINIELVLWKKVRKKLSSIQVYSPVFKTCSSQGNAICLSHTMKSINFLFGGLVDFFTIFNDVCNVKDTNFLFTWKILKLISNPQS